MYKQENKKEDSHKPQANVCVELLREEYNTFLKKTQQNGAEKEMGKPQQAFQILSQAELDDGLCVKKHENCDLPSKHPNIPGVGDWQRSGATGMPWNEDNKWRQYESNNRT